MRRRSETAQLAIGACFLTIAIALSSCQSEASEDVLIDMLGPKDGYWRVVATIGRQEFEISGKGDPESPENEKIIAAWFDRCRKGHDEAISRGKVAGQDP